MFNIKEFFQKRGFNFGEENSDIKPKKIILSENEYLSEKLQNKVFVYDCPKNAYTSFYVINTPLTQEELFQIKRYIWNENKYHLYFTLKKEKKSFIAALFYAKTNPREKEIKIASFKGDEQDSNQIEKISKWQFKSGLFWLNYSEFSDKIKKSKTLDKKLIETLKNLRKQLITEYEKNGTADDIEKTVQALIDRTLFIKFLEDRHIINSYFYKYYFDDSKTGYKKFLENDETDKINRLFKEINENFNNILFQKPSISPNDLTPEILKLICDMILEKKQIKQGIFYTPQNLAQLIIDDTIKKKGSVLDPSCGSGIFLIFAFRKLLQLNPLKSNVTIQIIKHRNRLIKDYIFGIEKEDIARRIAIFSLYLELLKDIDPKEIKEFIKNRLEKPDSPPIFPYDFSDNIITANSLEIEEEKIPHKNKKFDYIVGNPPFFQIKKDRDKKEHNFLEKYKTKIDGKTLIAKQIIGHKQISQCFMLRIKDWAKLDTNFGFVINGSNFYNEKSASFQKFFFNYYRIKKFYELSKVKDILFAKSKESVVTVIFNNSPMDNNTFNYYPIEREIFSDILIVDENKSFEIKQKDILNEKIKLRVFLFGNEFDLKLIKKLNNNNKFADYILPDNYYGFAVGMRITGKDIICKKLNITSEYYDSLSKQERLKLIDDDKAKYIRDYKDEKYSVPYIEYKDIDNFRANENIYISKKDILDKKFRRNKEIDFFNGDKLLLRRVSFNFNNKYIFPVYLIDNMVCFSDSVFSIRLKEKKDYHLIAAILNSYLINYYLNIVHVKRYGSQYPKINKDNIKNIPIPKYIDQDIKNEITDISKKLSDGIYEYKGKIADKLNDLVCDLYDLGYLEKRRIKDFFADNKEVTKQDLKEYKKTLRYAIELYFKEDFDIKTYIGKGLPFGLTAAAIYFNNSENQPTVQETLRAIIEQILKEDNKGTLLIMREKIFGTDAIYIIKNNQYQSWTETKAFEDGQEILRRFK